MIVLRIQHTVSSYDEWKVSFDQFADLRRRAGVRHYRISRSVQTPDDVTIDLEFGQVSDAEMLIGEVQQVWQRVSGTLIHNPQYWITEVVEAVDVHPAHLNAAD